MQWCLSAALPPFGSLLSHLSEPKHWYVEKLMVFCRDHRMIFHFFFYIKYELYIFQVIIFNTWIYFLFFSVKWMFVDLMSRTG